MIFLFYIGFSYHCVINQKNMIVTERQAPQQVEIPHLLSLTVKWKLQKWLY